MSAENHLVTQSRIGAAIAAATWWSALGVPAMVPRLGPGGRRYDADVDAVADPRKVVSRLRRVVGEKIVDLLIR